MKDIHERIWGLAWPYQDKRDDKGHAEITLNYAKKLVALENGNEDIVIPAIILHDIGWSKLSGQAIAILFDEKSTKEEIFALRMQHQNESVRLASGILNDINYFQDMVKEILEIISEHDTREGFISKDEGLVRDADKLWRFSEVGFETDVRRFRCSRKSHCDRLNAELRSPKYIYSNSAMKMALEELKLRKASS